MTYISSQYEELPVYLLHSKTYFAVLIDSKGNCISTNELFDKHFLPQALGESSEKFCFLHTIALNDQPQFLQFLRDCKNKPAQLHQIILRQIDKSNLHLQIRWEVSTYQSSTCEAIRSMWIGCVLSKSEIMHQKVRNFKKRLDYLSKNVSDGFYALDNNWRFLRMNKAAEKILGLPQRKLLGKVIWEVLPIKKTHNYPIQFRKAMYEQVTVCFEEYQPHLNKWFNVTAYPTSEGLVVFTRDITQEHNAKEQLQQSENKLRAILNSTSEAHILISPNYQILSFNKKANEISQFIYGKPLKENESIWEYIDEQYRQEFYEDTQKAFEGKYIQTERLLEVPPNLSAWFGIHYFPVYDTCGDLIGVAFNVIEIDERKRAEEKLRQSEYILRAIYHSTSEGIVFIDKNLKIQYCNQIIREFTKNTFGREAQPGDNPLDFIAPPMKAEFAEYYQRVLRGESLKVEKFDGKDWWLLSLFPVYDRENNFVGITQNAKNITERKQNELKILAQNETLKQIAWKQSHEVRRPVANILGLLNLMNEERYSEYFDTYLALLGKVVAELDQIIRQIVEQTNEHEYEMCEK